jgi:hypothetical protein
MFIISPLEIDKQKRARDSGARSMHTIAKVLWLGVIIVFAEKPDSKHARIIQQEFHCAKLNEKVHGPFTAKNSSL